MTKVLLPDSEILALDEAGLSELIFNCKKEIDKADKKIFAAMKGFLVDSEQEGVFDAHQFAFDDELWQDEINQGILDIEKLHIAQSEQQKAAAIFAAQMTAQQALDSIRAKTRREIFLGEIIEPKQEDDEWLFR